MNAWNEPPPVFEGSLSPHGLFQQFLKNTEIERTCIKSTNYVSLKSNHMFTLTIEKHESFLTILLVSGYAGLQKQEYLERREDCYNLLVSVMMTKTGFLECKRFLHLAYNNILNSSVKSEKVRPLINIINKQCILNFKPTSTQALANPWILIWKTWSKTVHTWQTH